MLRANIGYSTSDNSALAGKEIAIQSLTGLKNPKIGLLFTSIKYEQNKLIEEIKKINKNINIFGCTTSSEILVPDKIINSENGYGAMLVLDDNELAIGMASSIDGNDARETGRKVALEALNYAHKDYAPAYYMLIATNNEEQYMKGIQDIIGDVPCFGASINLKDNESIICGNKIVSNGIGLLLIYTDHTLENMFVSNYQETDNVGVITKVYENKILAEINKEPALKKYAEWTSYDYSTLLKEQILKESILKPLAIKNLDGDITILRHPLYANDDFSINMSNKIAKNTAIISMNTTVENLINAPSQTLEKIKSKLERPAAYFLIHSKYRKLPITEYINEVHQSLVQAANGIPFIMIFSDNEYGHYNHSGNISGSLMLSFTGFEK